MAGLVLSAAMEKSVSEIMTAAVSNFLQIECVLSSPTNPKLVINVRYINHLDIVQDFISNYTDNIELDIELTPAEYFDAIDNYQDLKCTLHFYNINKVTSIRIGRVLSFDSRFIFKNKQDLMKQYSRASLIRKEGEPLLEKHISTRIPITAQLMDPVIYNVRRTQMNFIARDVTMSDTLHLLTELVGLKKIYLVPPDNKTKYTNMILPPMLSVAEAFGYLQKDLGKGVYYKGFNYYFTNGIMYIYPLYEINPPSPNTVHIYRIGKDLWMGADSYHIYKGKDLHFVSNMEAIDKDSIELNLENYGSAFLIQNGKQVPDNWTYVDTKSKLQIAKNGIKTVQLNTKAGSVTDSYIPKFKFSSDNDYVHTSELASNNVVLMQAGWANAVPFALNPGWKIVWHYDDKDTYMTKTGTCLSVVYTIRQANRMTERNYICSANIRLQLAPEPDIIK